MIWSDLSIPSRGVLEWLEDPYRSVEIDGRHRSVYNDIKVAIGEFPVVSGAVRSDIVDSPITSEQFSEIVAYINDRKDDDTYFRIGILSITASSLHIFADPEPASAPSP